MLLCSSFIQQVLSSCCFSLWSMGCSSSRLALRAADKAKELLSSPTYGLSSSVTDEAKPSFIDDGTGISGPLGNINGPIMIKGAGSQTFEPAAACLPFRDISNELLSEGIPREAPSTDLGAEPNRGSSAEMSQSMAPADSSASVDDDVTPASSGSLNKRKSSPNLGLPAPDLVAALEGWGVLNEDLKEALLLRGKS